MIIEKLFKFCASSENKELITSPLDSTSAAVHIISLIKLSFLYNPSTPLYHLCVPDVRSAKRRKSASALVGLGFRVEWCVKALLESGEDSSEAANWLLSNAPREFVK